MTTSVIIQGMKLKNLELFRNTISKLLQSCAPNLVDVVESIPNSMLSHLGGTLFYWLNHLRMNSVTKDLFVLMKTLEAFSFWEGYMSAGGTLPPPKDESSIPEPRTAELVSNPDVCCIIPIGNLNDTIQMILSKTLSQIISCERIKKTVLVFDGIPNTLSFENERVETIEIPFRRGPAFCRNIGIRDTMSHDSDIIFLLDNDVLLLTGQPDQLIDGFLISKSHICLPLVESYGKGWMSRYHDVNGSLNGRYLERNRLLYATSCCTLVSTKVFEKTPLFSTDFVDAAGEDIDFSLRCLKAGFSIAGLDSTRILHWYGYTDVPESDQQILRARFQRYGAGECMLLKKHPDYYFLLRQSRIRPTSQNLPIPSQQWSQFLQRVDCVRPLLKLLKDGE